MLAWAAVPGAASPEDPLGRVGRGLLGLFAEPSALCRRPCVLYQPHLTKTFGR